MHDTATHDQVVVIGGGLAGLTAAASAARAGANVMLVDARPLGGRARTTLTPLADHPDTVAVFNAGPRALYEGGPGLGVLRDLGIDPAGAAPPLRPAFVVADGRPRRLPTGAPSLLRALVPSRRPLVGPASVPQLARLLATLQRIEPAELGGISAARWIDQLGLRDDSRIMLSALTRLGTYAGDLDELSADAAVTQLKLAVGESVRYLHGGWQQLVDDLTVTATAAGATLTRATVRSVRRSGDRWSVTIDAGASGDGAHDAGTLDAGTLGDGVLDASVLDAGAVVLAVGTPAAAAALSPVPIPTDGLGEPVTAACLELAVRSAGARLPQLVLGGDEPLYLARHSPPADLVLGTDADGVEVFHALRYGVRDARQDRQQLWAHAAAAGISSDDVVAQRFLARMTVSGGTPRPAGGLAARPPVEVPAAAGLYLAGDWVGPTGLLADAALSSGSRAAALATARVAASGGDDAVGRGTATAPARGTDRVVARGGAHERR